MKQVNKSVMAQVDFSEHLAEKRNCVVCSGENFKLWTQADIFDVMECQNCGLVFVNPCLNEEGLKIVYEDHHNKRVADAGECTKRERMYEIDRDFLLEVIGEGKVLDVGCGGGFFLNKFDSKKWIKSGLEIDKDTIDYALEHFGINDVRIWDSKTIPYDNNTFDAILFRGSYEHMVNPHLVAQEVFRALKPNGYFYICATPNVDSFCAKIYREKWNQFDAKEHIFMFSFHTLKRMMDKLGFVAVKSAAFYEETPYCNLEQDIQQVLKDYQLYREGKQDQMGISPAFWGNMLNIVFKKTKR